MSCQDSNCIRLAYVKRSMDGIEGTYEGTMPSVITTAVMLES